MAPAAEAIAHAMLDDPKMAWAVPEADMRVATQRLLSAASIERAIEQGVVHVSGNPILGVAIWMRRPAVDSPQRASTPSTAVEEAFAFMSEEGGQRTARFHAVMQQLRKRARPGAHAYLDTLGTLREHRRQGIATGLLEAGHAWADGLGLPCFLDTLTQENIHFDRRRVQGRGRGRGARLRNSDHGDVSPTREHRIAPNCGAR